MCVLSGANVTWMSSISLFSTQRLRVFFDCIFSGSFSSIPNAIFPMAASLDVWSNVVSYMATHIYSVISDDYCVCKYGICGHCEEREDLDICWHQSYIHLSAPPISGTVRKCGAIVLSIDTTQCKHSTLYRQLHICVSPPAKYHGYHHITVVVWLVSHMKTALKEAYSNPLLIL